MKRRDFLAAISTVLPAASMVAESLEEGMTKVKVTAEIDTEGCLVITVGYPSDCITSSYTVPVNQEEPNQTQIVFRPKAPADLSKLSQVQDRGRGKLFFWLISRRAEK